MQAAAADAEANGENAHYLSDGIHWSASGGQTLASAVLVPYLQAQLAAL